MSGYELKSIEQPDKTRSEAGELKLPEVKTITPGRRVQFSSQELRVDGDPVDRYNLVFLILLLHGVGTLMPWNMFINAEDYFRKFKLGSAASLNSTTSHSGLTRDRTDEELESLQKNFLSYLSLAAQLPNAIFNGLNLIVDLGSGNLKLRVNVTLVIEAIIFTLTIILASVDSFEWPGVFFYVTMISVVILNMASGIYQNCVFGIGAKFPGKFTNAILIGSNLSGTFTSIVNLLAIWLAPKPQEAAMYYFITALFVILLCLVSYNMLSLNPFFRFYDRADDELPNNTKCQLDIATVNYDEEEVGMGGTTQDVPDSLRKTVDAMVPKLNANNDNNLIAELSRKWQVFKKCWPQCMNVFFTFYITLALFPSVMAGVKQLGITFDEKYFSSVVCFLVFNIFALIGNLISGWTTWPGEDRVWALVAVRVLFVPFFLFCNFNPKTRQWPVLVESDVLFTLGNMLLALSSGYLSSLCMMFASSGLSQEDAPKAGMLAAFFLVFGIFMGINSSFILTWIVEIG